MTKIRILVLPIVVLATIVVTAGVAGAGNGATSTPFKFTDTTGGVSCSGVHILKTGPNPVHKESETCIDTSGWYSPGTYSLAPDAGGWWSDYHYYILHEPHPVVITDPNVAISGTIVVTDNGDGTFTWNAVSYYR
jgi:hypothetical protein